jgi:pre-rRNA-processing protein IPI3
VVTITSHSSPVTGLATLLRPPDLVGSKSDAWPVMEIKSLERTRVKAARDAQEVGIVLRSRGVESCRPTISKSLGVVVDDGRLAELESENKRLRAGLDRAVRLNEQMWKGIVAKVHI